MKSGERSGKEGFSLVELVIVIAVIVVIAAIVLPGLLSSKKAANEASAIASLRAIHSAMRVYVKRFHGAGTLEDLARTEMIDDELGSGTKSGYTFEVKIEGSMKDSGIIASPTSWGSTGERRFKINWMGQIYFTANEDDTSVTDGTPLGAASGQ
jgi:prepilin-type N-terminal cleavage/methylation domain-containing protein